MSLAIAALTSAAPPSPPLFTWSTVVNNTDLMPPLNEKKFNSYNQPSVNVNGLVVIRARSRGGPGDTAGNLGDQDEITAMAPSPGGGGGENQPIHGIYTRNMSNPFSPGPIVRILDRKTEVPQPNNIRRPPETAPEHGPLTTFIETPSFPRIDMTSNTIATRGNHQPVWKVLDPDTDDILEQVGTTGIYTNPFGPLITGASKLGGETERVLKDPVQEFPFFEVPEAPGTPFDVFPGAPAVTGGSTIVFKGNYTVGTGKTGVYYRDLVNEPIPLDGTSLSPAGGTKPVVLIANNTDTFIPGTSTKFGSTSPPSAANGMAVFAGFDNEENPTLGGIYLAPLTPYDYTEEQPELTTLVRIGDPVPGERKGAVFNRLGEGVAFDGRYVAFWGAWGAMQTIRLHCPTEGNKDRIAFCLTQCPEPQGCSAKVPVKQGIFLHDTQATSKDKTWAVATTDEYGDFLFWNFSGMVPGVGGGEDGSEEDGEPARWRSSAFVAVSGTRTAFKAVASNNGVQGGCQSCHSGNIGSAPPSPSHGRLMGIYLNQKPGQATVTVVDNRTPGESLDPDDAPEGSLVTEVGLEREGLRGDWLAVSAKMAVPPDSTALDSTAEVDGMAGVYITKLPEE
jgi:hypothetical protein